MTRPTPPNTEVDADAHIRSGLERYLSAQTGGPVAIAALQRPTANGFSADTFLIQVRSDALPPRIVVQAAPIKDGLFERYDIARTYRVQEALGPCAVPTAQMRWLCEDDKWIGAPFYVMDHVDGRVPSDRPPYHEAGWLHDGDANQQQQIWNSGIEAMAALHRVDPAEFEFLGEQHAHDWSGQRINEWREFGEELGPDAEPTLLAALASLYATRPEANDLRVHWGDAKLGNMIFAEGQAAAILDWELCGLSAPEEDIAHWLAVDWYLSTGRGYTRLPGLPGFAASVDTYEAALGRAANDVGWWFAFALVRMGLIFQRAAATSSSRRGRPMRPNILAPFAASLVDGTLWSQLNAR